MEGFGQAGLVGGCRRGFGHLVRSPGTPASQTRPEIASQFLNWLFLRLLDQRVEELTTVLAAKLEQAQLTRWDQICFPVE